MNNPITASATKLRLSLSAALVLLIVIIVSVVIFGVGWLNRYAQEVNAVAVEAQQSDSRIDSMRSEAAFLESHAEASERAKRIVADASEYAHQDQIIRDLQGFAQRAGINVLSYDFTADSSSSESSASSTAPEPTAADPAVDPAMGGVDPMNPAGAAPAPAQSSARSTQVSISIEEPVNYVDLLRFMHYIEQNLTKMQIASVSLTSDAESDGRRVSAGGFTIEVYIR